MSTLNQIVQGEQERLQYIKAEMKCEPATEHTTAGYVFRVIDTRNGDVLWTCNDQTYYETRYAFDYANMMVAVIRISEWNSYTHKVDEWWKA